MAWGAFFSWLRARHYLLNIFVVFFVTIAIGHISFMQQEIESLEIVHFYVPLPPYNPPHPHHVFMTSWWGPHPIINIIALWQFWKVKSQNGFSDFSFSPVDPLTVDYQKGRDPGDWIWKRNAENNFTLMLVFSQKNIPEYLFSKVVECLQQYHLGTQYIACIGLSRLRHMHAQHRIHTPHTNVKDRREKMEWGDDCLITIIYHESWYVLVQFGFCLLRSGPCE